MAFDAVSATPAPVQAAAKGKGPAGKGEGETSPFDALMAMLDGADTAAAQPVQTSVVPGAAPSADAPAESDTPKAGQDEAVPAQADAPAPDATAMMAALVAPAPPVQPAPAPETMEIATTKAGIDTPAAAAPEALPVSAPSQPLEADETVVPPQPFPSNAASDPAPARVPPAPVELAAPATAQVQTETQTQAPAQPVAKAAAEPAAPKAAAAPATEGRPITGDVQRADAGERPEAIAPVQGGQTESGEGDQQAGDHERDRPQGETRQAVAADPASASTAASGGAPAFAPAIETAATAAPVAPQAPQAAAAPAVIAAAPPTPAAAAQSSVQTVAHLAAQLVQRINGQTTRFDLTLNPQSLGRVDVRIEIDRQGALKARMAFDNPATAQELSGRHAELRAALESAGFELAEGALSFDAPSGGGGQGGFEQNDAGSGRLFQAVAEAADPAPAALKSYFDNSGASGVDIRV